MKKIKRRLRGSLFIQFGLFIFLVAYFCYSIFMYSDRWFSDPNNVRTNVDMNNPQIIPGNIQDRNNSILVETKKTKGKDGEEYYYRDYSEKSRYAAHVVGSKKYGIGAEVFFTRYLLGYNNSFVEKTYQKIFLDQEYGNNVILTIDIRLQEYISQLLGSKKGSVVLLDPTTSEILAMVSSPSFDPLNQTDEVEDEALLNKAIYGRYTPGSVMKIITAASAIEHLPNWEAITIDCNGSTNVDGIKINCYNENAHGVVNIHEAMDKSCNAFFAKITLDLGWKSLKETAEDFNFNKDFNFRDIKCVKSLLSIDENTEDELLAWTGIGQGETLVSPLHMALIISAIANDGVMMEPKLIRGIESMNNDINYFDKAKILSTPISSETAHKLSDMLTSAVESGTGSGAQVGSVKVAGKSGTAEHSSDDDTKPNAWFVGFSSTENPTLAIAIVLEDSGTGGAQAAPIAGQILDKAHSLGY